MFCDCFMWSVWTHVYPPKETLPSWRQLTIALRSSRRVLGVVSLCRYPTFYLFANNKMYTRHALTVHNVLTHQPAEPFSPPPRHSNPNVRKIKMRPPSTRSLYAHQALSLCSASFTSLHRPINVHNVFNVTEVRSPVCLPHTHWQAPPPHNSAIEEKRFYSSCSWDLI